MGGSSAATSEADDLVRELARVGSGDGSIYLVDETGNPFAHVAKYFEEELSLRVHPLVRGLDLADVTASVVYLFGGNPAAYVRRLAGSSEWDALLAALRRGASLAGSSAGAECLGSWARDLAPDAHPHWIPGLALFPRSFIGTHWNGSTSDAEAATWRRAFNQSLIDGAGKTPTSSP